MPKEKLLKLFKLISINIILILVFFICLEFIIYKFLYPKLEGVEKQPFQYSLKKYKTEIDEINRYRDKRKPVGLDYKSGSIIVFGCSYAYGSFLSDEDTFSYKLSKELKRPAYNFASPGFSPQFALIDIQSGQIDEIIKNTDYAVLVVIGEHVYRVHAHSNGFSGSHVWPRYIQKNINGKKDLIFKEQKYPFIEGSYTYKYFRKLLYAKFLMPSYNPLVRDYMFDFIKLHFIKINEELKKRNPDIKFIIIVYQDQAETRTFTRNERWKEIEDEGITVINIQKKIPHIFRYPIYSIPNDGHPSAKAWTEIVDYLTNKRKLF